MANAEKRLQELKVIISYLKEELKKAENEQDALLKEHNCLECQVIDAMPIRVRKALKLSGITTDTELKHFLDGEYDAKNSEKSSVLRYFAYFKYPKAQNRIERLMCIRNVGKKTADEAMCIIQEKGL